MTDLTIDELAEQALQIKEAVRSLREEGWKIEQELANRLITLNAKVLEGSDYRVRTSTKRDVKIDTDQMDRVFTFAVQEGLADLATKAFKRDYKVSLRGLDELLKRGGKTREAVEAAIVESNEKTEFTYEKLS